MAPEGARVFIAEDDVGLRRRVRVLVQDAGHTVVSEVATLDDALEAVERLKEEGVNVAILDGNLAEGDISGNDGTQIATALRKEIPGVKIISLSSQEQTYGDVHVSKRDFKSVVNLGETIKSL